MVALSAFFSCSAELASSCRNCSSPPGIELRVLLGEATQQEIADLAVPVGPAQVMVAVGADHMHVVAVDADDGGVERPAAEIEDEDVPLAAGASPSAW